MENKLGVYKMNLDFNRAGNLESIFVADSSHIKELIDSGIEVYFGEVLGKHSDISCSFEESDFKLISDDEQIVKIFQDNDINVGYNPFYRYTGEYDDDNNEITVLDWIIRRLATNQQP